MLKYCENCGAEMGDLYRFCPSCGAPTGPVPEVHGTQFDNVPQYQTAPASGGSLTVLAYLTGVWGLMAFVCACISDTPMDVALSVTSGVGAAAAAYLMLKRKEYSITILLVFASTVTSYGALRLISVAGGLVMILLLLMCKKHYGS